MTNTFCICLSTAFVLLLCGSVVTAAEYRFVKSFPVAVEEPSGLAYDTKTDTLWTVRDGGGGLYQIDKRGIVLETIDVPSSDLEGIAYKPSTDTFLLAEERNREIKEIDRQGKTLRTVKVPINYRLWHLNHGLEGIGYDPENGHVFVVNEKAPRRVMELDEGGTIAGSFEVDEAGDLSGIHRDTGSGNLLILSHESKKVMEYTPGGKLLGSFTIDVPKAEGITMDADGNIYIICDETNTLYVYSPVEG